MKTKAQVMRSLKIKKNYKRGRHEKIDFKHGNKNVFTDSTLTHLSSLAINRNRNHSY